MTEIKFELPNMLQGKELCMLRQRYPLILHCLTSSTTFPFLGKFSLYFLENYENGLFCEMYSKYWQISGKVAQNSHGTLATF